jgi:alpha-beta hydrolase superfamily lysophospholipase
VILLLALSTLVAAALAHFDRAENGTVLALALATAAALVYSRAVAAWLSVVPGYDELHMLRTDDGWTLPLYRYRPPAAATGAVLMVHGIYSTMGLFDVGPDMSLARHLQALGLDVYCLELRDMGVHGRRSRWYALHKDGATFDDYVFFDLPAAVRHVQRVSGFQQIAYVGHSMGGMIFYPYGGTTDGARAISRAVTLGSMAALPEHRWLRYLPIPWGLLARLPHYGVHEASAFLLAPLVGVGWAIELIFMNPKNVDARHRRRYFFNGVANSPFSLIRQFAGMYRARALRSRDQQTDFAALLRQNHVPTLVVGSPSDHIAAFSLVRKGYEALPGEKRWLEAKGFGHNDLVLGRAARERLWPEIVAWISARDQ